MFVGISELRLTAHFTPPESPLVCLSGGYPLSLRLSASIRTQSSASDAAAAAAVYLITAIEGLRLLKATLRLS